MELVSLRNASKFNNCIATLDMFDNSLLKKADNETSSIEEWPLILFSNLFLKQIIGQAALE
jgi:hypothetical protein